MLKLGNLIEEDIFLLEFETVKDIESWEENYKFHLINNEFKSFKIGIPFDKKDVLVPVVTDFIESFEIKGSWFVYLNISNEVKLGTVVNNHQTEFSDKKLFLLPDKNCKYAKLSSDFWDLNLLGYEIAILKCDSMKECQSNLKTISKYILKGARIGITGSNKHSLGILHKRKITHLFEENMIDFWITETIDQSNSSYLQEIKLKTELLISAIK